MIAEKENKPFIATTPGAVLACLASCFLWGSAFPCVKIGYELFEVRSGRGLKPIYRNGYTPKGTIEAVKAEAHEILAKAFGKDGAEKRARLEELQKKVLGEWEEGGSSRRDVSNFLDTL